MRGVLTMALKHPLYGRYAYNLALSIKSADMNVQVAVIADEAALKHLHPGQRMIFDHIIEPAVEKPLVNKFHIINLSPFDETLFVDADMIFSPLADFNEFWRSMTNVSWTMANRGKDDKVKGISEWTTKEDVDKVTDSIFNDDWYDLSSEWIYFKKNELSYTIFAKAEMYYDMNTLKVREFAGDRPDEPYFNLALNSIPHEPHQAPYQPTYWQPAMKGFPGTMAIKKGWMAFSVGGNLIPQQQMQVYDELAKNASFRMNMPSMKITQKFNQLSERKVI
jgi:hypothetical protein